MRSSARESPITSNKQFQTIKNLSQNNKSPIRKPIKSRRGLGFAPSQARRLDLLKALDGLSQRHLEQFMEIRCLGEEGGYGVGEFGEKDDRERGIEASPGLGKLELRSRDNLNFWWMGDVI